VVGEADNHPFPEYSGNGTIHFPTGLFIDDFESEHSSQLCCAECLFWTS
jgi:hypothetical protein